jgi:hypothetical protein
VKLIKGLGVFKMIDIEGEGDSDDELRNIIEEMLEQLGVMR